MSDKMKGRLQIKPIEGYQPRERLRSFDLQYLLDGEPIKNLKHIKLEIDGNTVVSAELTLWLTDVEIDLPDVEYAVAELVRG